METLLDRIGVDSRVTLVLHDWGGPIGMTWASRHPERVARLVVFNTAAFLLPAGKRLHWSLRWSIGSRLAALLILGFNAFVRTVTHVGCRLKPMPAEVAGAYRAPHDSWGNRLSTLRFVEDIPLTPEHPSYQMLKDTDESLSGFRDTPMLLCWGGKDFVFDRDFLDEWVRRFPQAEVHRFPEAGHCLLEEVPDQIEVLMRDFFARHPLG